MSEKLHTPEPWATEYREDYEEMYHQDIFDAKGETIAICSWFKVKVDARTTTTNREANARRIVACVNALEGIPTAILEMAGTGLMSEAAVEVGNLTAQRDSLLSALRALYGWQRAEVEHFGATTPDDFIIEMVEKALNNA